MLYSTTYLQSCIYDRFALNQIESGGKFRDIGNTIWSQ